MHDRLTCEATYALIVPYMLDTLGRQEDAAIEAHLARCEPCAAYFASVHDEYCAQVQQAFDRYVDRELSKDERRLVERHLRACGRCAELFRFEGAMLRAIRGRLSGTDTSGASRIIAALRVRLAGGSVEVPP